MHTVVLAAGLFVFVAHLLEVVFERTRIPDILLLMVLGVLAGEGALNLIPMESFGEVGEFLAIVTLAVILFESGLGLKVKSLLQSAGRAAPFSLLSMVSAIACLTVALRFLEGMDWWTALLGGLIMGGTSSAVVIPMVKALDLGEGTGTVLTLESTLTDVFCIIGTVGVAVSLAAGDKPLVEKLLGEAGFSLIAACLLGAGAGLFWSVLLSQADRLASTMLTTVAGALVVYGFCEQMGVSGAIATLTFGITLGNLPRGVVLRVDRGADAAPIKLKLREVKRVERAVYAEVVFLLKAAFFFYLGMKVDPGNFLSMAGVVAIILALVPFFPRYPSVRLLLGPKGSSRRDALLATVLVPRGLAAAVLAQVPVQLFKKMVESLNSAKVNELKEAAAAGGADFSVKGYCDAANEVFLKAENTVGLLSEPLPPGCEKFLQADGLADVVAMMVFFSIAIVSLMVFLVERGALAAVGQFAFGAYATGEDPQAGSPEPEAQTSHTPDS